MKFKFVPIILLGILFMNLFMESALAIPAFARRYKVSCTTCHSVFPRLKAYGDEFAGNGFIMKEEEKKRDYVTAGDELLWLNKDFPIAARIDMFVAHDQGNEVKNDFQTPWGLKLLSGGTLYKNIGYYFYFYMSERGEVAGIEDAYLHFDNIFNTNLDIMAGQFQVCDPLMKRELRLTYEDYMIYKSNIGLSHINLAYDRGVIFAYNYDKTATDLFAMVVNGNGKGEAENRKMDQDNYKSVAVRVNQQVGQFFTIGGFYYSGKEKYPDSSRTNTVTFWGPDFSFGIDQVEITAQYLYREDSNPLFMNHSNTIKTDGIVLEVMMAPQIGKSRYYVTGLYNKVDSDLYKYETATLSYSYLLSRNLRLVGEYTRDLENKDNRVVFGAVGAF